jgi:hypothetical protein
MNASVNETQKQRKQFELPAALWMNRSWNTGHGRRLWDVHKKAVLEDAHMNIPLTIIGLPLRASVRKASSDPHRQRDGGRCS